MDKVNGCSTFAQLFEYKAKLLGILKSFGIG